MISDKGKAFWDYNLLEKNLNFINQIDPEYFDYIAQLHFNILNDEDKDSKNRHHAALSLRSAYSQGLEVLFSLLFATIQAPDCVIGWILKCSNEDLRKVVDKFAQGENITTNYIDPIETWTDVSDLIFSLQSDEKRVFFRSKIEGFARLWSKFAKEFTDQLNIDEYNGIKHGLRVKMGGHHFLFGQPDHLKIPLENQKWHTVSKSEFGTTFFTAENIGETPNVVIHQYKRNWNPEKYFHALLLISTSIKNILYHLNSLYGNQNYSDYLFPEDGNFYEIPWRFDESSHLSIKSIIAKENLPLLKKEVILSVYEKKADSEN